MPWSRLSRFFWDGNNPTFNDGILIMGPYKPLRNWIDFPIPYYMEIMGVCSTRSHICDSIWHHLWGYHLSHTDTYTYHLLCYFTHVRSAHVTPCAGWKLSKLSSMVSWHSESLVVGPVFPNQIFGRIFGA